METQVKTLTSIIVTDSASSLLSMTAPQLKADADALKLVTGDYKLSVTGVAAADVTKTLTTKNIYSVEVKDTAANILKNLTSIQTAVTAAKIQNVVITDAANPSLSISDIFALTTTLPNVTLAAGVKFNVKDTASTVIAHARDDIGDVLKNAGTVTITDKTTPNLTLADAITLKGITNLAAGTKYNVTDGGSVIATQAAITGEKILSGAASVTVNKNFTISDAKAVTGIKTLAKGTVYSITDTTDNILAQSAVSGDKILSGANTVTVVDTSANIVAKLDQLEVLAKAGKIADIKFTDTPTAALNITNEQLVKNAEAIGKIISHRTLPALIITKPATPNYQINYDLSFLNIPKGSYPLYSSSDGNTFLFRFDIGYEAIYTNNKIIDLRQFGGENYHVNAISGDGNTVVGYCKKPGNEYTGFIIHNNKYSELDNIVPTNISYNSSIFIGYRTYSPSIGVVGFLDNNDQYSVLRDISQKPRLISNDNKLIVCTKGTNDAGEINILDISKFTFTELGINAIPRSISDDNSILIGSSDDGSNTYNNGFICKIDETGMKSKNIIPSFAPYGMSLDSKFIYGQSNQYASLYYNGNLQYIHFDNSSSVSSSALLICPISKSGDIIGFSSCNGQTYTPAFYNNGKVQKLPTTTEYPYGNVISVSSDGKKILGFVSNLGGEIKSAIWTMQ